MTRTVAKPRAASQPSVASPARRKFIVASAATATKASAAGPVEVNAWVVVKPDDTCVIRIARSEMGQGTLTGLAQLVV